MNSRLEGLRTTKSACADWALAKRALPIAGYGFSFRDGQGCDA